MSFITVWTSHATVITYCAKKDIADKIFTMREEIPNNEKL